ncbi:CPBP family intramembrane glutamic endopeptidase [Agromyces aerolatus]|uniref:CPBP family intramembrane glutamic endopeptidase n=1 Tax=Agromyces sp. LY-1074 TaxID=3074080 RepID=UPI002867959D|nr:MULTISPECIES: CPBP family intramembrane glutamic endopeptidase [unclassified Agromyces]MDR5698898.1 CPBP family intramembrane glutamic endopeptidase [Agromyces sp. LY-1074]MDR5705324.1 CPBP family intramembrane glutamic endopeptidase [Agromyces sp. LY-1358]
MLHAQDHGDRDGPPPEASASRLRLEVAIVLALSLGASAVYSLVSIVARLTDERPLSQQSAAINQSRSSREWLDFTYQFLDVVFGLAVVALVLYLLWRPDRSPFRRIGFDLTRPGRDLAAGVGLVLVIGVPGLALYAAGRALGITVAVVPSPIDTHWWTIPILVLAALKAALTEELIVVGYLFTRLRELGVGPWATIVSSALLRGTYHLYQGIGPFAGNVAMGIVFGWCYHRWGRTMPLVIAHWILDMVSFIGYPLALGWWPELFAPPAG